MKTIKFHKSTNSSSFSRLSDDIVLEIISKLINLRTLCFCKLVSKRIVCQVDTISISYRRHPSQLGFPKRLLRSLKKGIRFNLCSTGVASSYPDSPTSECEFIKPAIESMEKFKRLKSLCIELPSFLKKTVVFDNDLLFKWEIKFSNKADSFIFLSPTAICYSNSENRQEEEEDTKLTLKNFFLAMNCWHNAMLRFIILFDFTILFPLLKKLSVKESSKSGRISLSGENIAHVSNRLNYNFSISGDRVSKCYIPLLELPVSGCIMKEVTLYLIEWNNLPDGDDSFMNTDLDDNDFEDKDEEAAYNEAVIEIFRKHWGRIKRLR